MGQCRTRRSWVGSLCGERPPSDRARSFAGCMMRRLPVGREGDAWERRWAFGILPQRGAADETLAVPPRVAATVGLSLFGCLRTKWQEALGEGSLVADDDRRRPLWPCNTSSPTPPQPPIPPTLPTPPTPPNLSPLMEHATVAREPPASAASESKPGTALLLVAAILALLSISRLASRLPCFRAGPCVQATCRCTAPTRSEFSKIGVLQD